MTDLFIPVGIPGCGKSTWGEIMFGQAACHSTDAIRAEPEFGGDVNKQSNNDAVFIEFHRRILADLENWGSTHRVYADATNVTSRARHKLYKLAEIAKVDVHLVVFNNLTQAYARNARRDRVVPPEAMARMLQNFEQTLMDLPYEGSVTSTTFINNLV
jgi:predicted kinase